ncbi:hypothetical protein [Lonsdalea populi]|uniref:hypothetical protein n=1 Tax=Lonsdalea populi TaxID=1172565 RepID=UPI000A1FB5FD|nr:hypothetical protein [Lonsdalea populi]OSN02624.1 hypothetical protein AU499_00520 [Lonsdalea populi]QPQ25618.1 hypothetical protein I6N93_07650 [Lonsdalea populi]RAT48064.1 hypothetical protein AU494_00135 [Lonsdalea populi]RAT58457.1 hypothetical protein AU500_02825 [Lonsdalea populi]RAT64166.1 hypothetical protein AU501_01060 [Lonsdalea populi]
MTDSTLTDVESGAAFIAAMNRQQPTRWQPQSGIELRFQYGESGGWALELSIQPDRQYPGLVRQILGRCYERDAETEGAHIFLREANVLTIGWLLWQPAVEYPQAVRELFQLAGVEFGDVDRTD